MTGTLILGLTLAGAAALVHVYIFVLESLRWTEPGTRRVFGIRTDEEARITRPLAFNQGFYNLFLALIAAAGVVLVLIATSPIRVAASSSSVSNARSAELSSTRVPAAWCSRQSCCWPAGGGCCVPPPFRACSLCSRSCWSLYRSET